MSGKTAITTDWKSRRHSVIAGFAVAAIAAHLILRFALHTPAGVYQAPLLATLVAGGIPLVVELLLKLAGGQFGSDLLAGISIVTSVWLDEYLAGSLVVLMLSGGEALENYAVRSASSVLGALARRMPSTAHHRLDGRLEDIPVERVGVGDVVTIYPHETCPVDGVVVEGHGVMDESYLTGEPFRMSKTPGAGVISGAINGDDALTIRATRLAADSRYARIMEVMRASEQHRPRLRRLGDQLGAWYTPLALVLAAAAWAFSRDADRFLAVLVVATPCPLLIGIPVAIIGAISLAAKRGIIVKNPAVLEQIDRCQTVMLDKTGTLTYGEPTLTEQLCARQFDPAEVLRLVASVEQYSKHPLARAILAAAREAGLELQPASEISERPGEGLRGVVEGQKIWITSRGKLLAGQVRGSEQMTPARGGLECAIAIDDCYAATYRFHDAPRAESVSFVAHLQPRHHVKQVMIVSGDREPEVRYLADQVGVTDVLAEQSPEQKLDIVQEKTRQDRTLYIGDGINDAPSLMAATVGMAIGLRSEVTSEAADVVVMDNSLKKVDEFIHISRRMRAIALQSAIGGIALSLAGMGLAAAGYLPPVAGAITQEIIDVIAVLNALRAAVPPRAMADF